MRKKDSRTSESHKEDSYPFFVLLLSMRFQLRPQLEADGLKNG